MGGGVGAGTRGDGASVSLGTGGVVGRGWCRRAQVSSVSDYDYDYLYLYIMFIYF